MAEGGFRVACSKCQRESTVARQEVFLVPAGETDGFYIFPCPLCHLISSKVADALISKLLSDNGASLQGWTPEDDRMMESLYG